MTLDPARRLTDEEVARDYCALQGVAPFALEVVTALAVAARRFQPEINSGDDLQEWIYETDI